MEKSAMKSEFDQLFQMTDGKIEDARFWCEPVLTSKAVDQIASFGFPVFDGIASLEARGYFLAGMAAVKFHLPTVLIRKHKSFYENMAHAKVDFTNWKNEPETITVLKASMPAVKRVLIVDDILDTGNSLIASRQLLRNLGIDVVGAFYLLNAGSDELLKEVGLPVGSVKKQRLFQ